MSKAFEYIQVPLTVVATDLTGASVEAEGAYFRAARLIAVNGPMTLEAIRRKIGTHEDVEQALNVRSSDAEPLLSFRWLEDWRERANAARDRTSKAGLVSAEKRAKKRKKVNTSSTPVEQQVNGSSTNVEHPTILYSTITQERKELASETDERFDALWKTYEGKGAKGKARDYWKKLDEADRSAIIAKAPEYVAATSGENLTYRKNLEGWINPQERRWEGPIPTRRDEVVSKPKVWTKEEAIIEVRRLRELHGADFQTHHVPKDVLTAYRQMS